MGLTGWHGGHLTCQAASGAREAALSQWTILGASVGREFQIFGPLWELGSSSFHFFSGHVCREVAHRVDFLLPLCLLCSQQPWPWGLTGATLGWPAMLSSKSWWLGLGGPGHSNFSPQSFFLF